MQGKGEGIAASKESGFVGHGGGWSGRWGWSWVAVECAWEAPMGTPSFFLGGSFLLSCSSSGPCNNRERNQSKTKLENEKERD